jgi:hypothetical protein
MISKNEYLNQFLAALKGEYREDNGWRYEERIEEGYIKMTYVDSYDYVEIVIDLNEYKVPVKLYFTRADLTEEIIVPESCHICDEDCEYYDPNSDECTLSDEEINREFEEWERVLFESEKITIKRVVVSVKCYLDIPHYHYYKGYEIVLNESLLPETVISLDNLFDIIVSLVEK